MSLIATSIMSLWLIFMLYRNFTSGDWDTSSKLVEMPWLKLVICRTILAWYLHLIMNTDNKQGHRMMKYALNHPWKFRASNVAYIIGLIQSIVSVFSEFISIAILLSTRTYIDAVKDFIALVVINDFDNMIFNYLKDEKLSKLIANGNV